MIKLFRNTRRKLLAENKFSKYLVYAVGEIFLVVVGILIALWINNANQESINEKKAEVILKEIQRDLKKDIEGSKKVIKTFIKYDSIARLLLWDKFTADQMFGDTYKGRPFEIVYEALTFETTRNGYVNFNRNLNSIPAKYDVITNKLKDLYDITGVGLKVANERKKSIAFENMDKTNRFDWSVATIKGSMPEEAKNYYMRDLEFKKQLLKYMNGIKNVFLATENYRLKAIQLHNNISEILNSDDMLPYPGLLNAAQNASELNNILGTYKLKESSNPFFPPIIEISEINNKIQLFAEGFPERRFYRYDETTFFSIRQRETRSLTNIKFTKSKNIDFFLAADKSIYAYYTKVNN